MFELKYIEVRVAPSYYVQPNGVETRELRVDAKFNGREYHHREQLYQSDAISLLDYCFDRAKRYINSAIEEADKKTEER